MTCHLELQFSTTVKVVEKLRSKCLVPKNLFSACFHTKMPQKYYENLDKSIVILKTP